MRTFIQALRHARRVGASLRPASWFQGTESSASRSSAKRSRSLQVEGLEDRRLLSINPVTGALGIGGDSEPAGGLWLAETEPAFEVDDSLASLTMELTQNTAEGIQGRLSVPGLLWQTVQAEGEDFLQLGVPDWYSTLDVGRPELPVFRVSLQIPANVAVSSEFDVLETTLLDADVPIYPRQPELCEAYDLPESAFDFVIDRDYYVGLLAPTEGVGLGGVSGVVDVSGPIEAGMVTTIVIEFSPFQYDPTTGKVDVATSVDFNISFEPVEAQGVEGAVVEGAGVEGAGADFVSTVGSADYIIITADAFYDAVLPLAQWKQKSGYKTYVAKMSEVGTTQTDIFNYLQAAYLADSTRPSYVLLVGDHENVPSYEVIGHPYYDDPNYLWHTDYEYTRLGGTDYVPDVAMSRLPGDTAAQITIMVNKILTYETNPDTGDWYDDVLLAGQFQDSEGDDDPNYIEDRYFMQDVHRAADFLGGDYDFWSGDTDPYNKGYTVHTKKSWGSNPQTYTLYYRTSSYPGRITTPSPVPAAWYNKADEEIVATINNGTWLVMHRDHGSSGGWGSPSLSTNSVKNMTNGNKLPVVFSINCETGLFDTSDAFGEAWMRNANGGAVAMTGAMRVSYSGPNDTFHVGVFDSMFTDYDASWSSSNYLPSWQFGKLMNYAKDRVFSGYGYTSSSAILVARLFNAFGDPSMDIRDAVPQSLSVTYPTTFFVGSPSEYAIQVTKGGTALYGAKVCISKDGSNDYWVGTTNGSGKVTFAGLAPSETGTYNIVVTERNAIPFQGTIQAVINGVDLQGSELTVSPTNLFVSGGTATAPFSVYNAGNTAAGGFDVRFYLSDDATVNPATDIPLTFNGSATSYHVASLAALASHTASVTLNVPATDPFGTDNLYHIGMVVDSGGTVAEVDETNNSGRGLGLDLAKVEYTDPVVTLPFFEDWETGTTPRAWWDVASTNDGRIQITSSNGPFAGGKHLTMDDSIDDSTSSLNQLTLHANLAGQRGIVLEYANREWSDDDHAQDSVSISVDGGATWHTVVALTGTNSTATYVERSYYLDDLGLTYSANTLIRFQQYDDDAISAAGMAFDNIRLYSVAGVLDHFEIEPIDESQYFGEPIPVTVKAMDRTNVPVPDFNGAVDLSAKIGGEATLYSATFETGASGWTATANWSPGDWELGTPTSGPNAAHSGSKLWATQLEKNYTSASYGSTNYSYLSQTFDFTGYTDVELSWWQWLQVNNGDDVASVKVNGNTVYSSSNATAPTSFEQVAIDLSAYDNQSDVQIVFEFKANWIFRAPGWYVDDIVITGMEPPVAVATSLSQPVTFDNGVWGGDVTILETVEDVYLVSDDGAGRVVKSNTFDAVPGDIRDYGDAPTSQTGGSLTTLTSGINSADGCMFDVTAINTLVVDQVDLRPRWNGSYQVYYKAGSYVGFEQNAAAWTLLGIADAAPGPAGTCVPLDLPLDVAIPSGETYSFYIVSLDGDLYYSNGTEAGAVQVADENLQVRQGIGMVGLFGSQVFTPRVFNGTVHYTAGLTYPTTVLDDGARHLAQGPLLGTARDTEPNGQESDGDDEDGVAFVAATLFASPNFANTSATVQVTLTNADPYSNMLDAWIDFNMDGDWSDPGEQIFNYHDLGTADGVQTLTFTIPQISGTNVKLGETYARFRLSSMGGVGPNGAADDGEVEDYLVTIVADTINRPGDANRDGTVNDADAAILAEHWLTRTGALWEDGDFNGDGAVDDRDAAILAAHWIRATAEQAAVEALPEPEADSVADSDIRLNAALSPAVVAAVAKNAEIGPRALATDLVLAQQQVEELTRLQASDPDAFDSDWLEQSGWTLAQKLRRAPRALDLALLDYDA